MPTLLISRDTVLPAVSLADVKAQCRIDASAEDGLLELLIAAVQQACEDQLGRTLMAATWETVLAGFHVCAGGDLPLARPPVRSVVSVKFLDAAGVEQTLDPAAYLLDNVSHPPRLVLAHDAAWPATPAVPNAVRVRFSAGYATPSDVPAPVRQWLLLHIGHLYQNREATSAQTLQPLPYADSLLDPYRLPTI